MRKLIHDHDGNKKRGQQAARGQHGRPMKHMQCIKNHAYTHQDGGMASKTMRIRIKMEGWRHQKACVYASIWGKVSKSMRIRIKMGGGYQKACVYASRWGVGIKKHAYTHQDGGGQEEATHGALRGGGGDYYI